MRSHKMESLSSAEDNKETTRTDKRATTEFHNRSRSTNIGPVNLFINTESPQYRGASWRSKRSYTGEIPRIVIHLEDDAFLSPNRKATQVKTEPEEGSFEGIKFGDRAVLKDKRMNRKSDKDDEDNSDDNDENNENDDDYIDNYNYIINNEIINTEDSEVDIVGVPPKGYMLARGVHRGYSNTEPDQR